MREYEVDIEKKLGWEFPGPLTTLNPWQAVKDPNLGKTRRDRLEAFKSRLVFFKEALAVVVSTVGESFRLYPDISLGQLHYLLNQMGVRKVFADRHIEIGVFELTRVYGLHQKALTLGVEYFPASDFLTRLKRYN